MDIIIFALASGSLLFWASNASDSTLKFLSPMGFPLGIHSTTSSRFGALVRGIYLFTYFTYLLIYLFYLFILLYFQLKYSILEIWTIIFFI